MMLMMMCVMIARPVVVSFSTEYLWHLGSSVLPRGGGTAGAWVDALMLQVMFPSIVASVPCATMLVVMFIMTVMLVAAPSEMECSRHLRRHTLPRGGWTAGVQLDAILLMVVFILAAKPVVQIPSVSCAFIVAS